MDTTECEDDVSSPCHKLLQRISKKSKNREEIAEEVETTVHVS